MKKPLTDKEGEVRELTKNDIKSFKAASEVLPLELAVILPQRKPGQRGSQKSPTKESVTIRFSRDVLDFFRESGSGWQTKIDNALKDWVAHHKKAA
jgi:uncharacterized protein (DUF4415 family)